MATIKTTDIVMPEHYVRGKISGKNVNDLMDVVVKANGHLFKSEKNQDWKELIGKKIAWPFHSPIMVVKLKPEAGKKINAPVEGKGKKKGKTFKPYEIVDGGHRLTVWRRLKQKEIEAVVKQIDDPADRFLEQYRTNASHGLRLDKDDRDNAIRIAHNVYKLSLNALAKETGLDRSSVIRILADKQRKKGPRAAAKKGETFNAPKVSDTDMSASGFIERLQILINIFPKLSSEVSALVDDGMKGKDKNKFKPFADRLHAIAALFEPKEETEKGS